MSHASRRSRRKKRSSKPTNSHPKTTTTKASRIKKWPLVAVLGVVLGIWFLAGRETKSPAAASPTEPAIPTGPAVGAKIPDFKAVDQDGRQRSFENLKGPNGLVLVFLRSAAW